MFAITAIAVNRSTSEPEYFLLRALVPGAPARVDPAAPEVVYRRVELVDFLDVLGSVVVLRGAHPPHPVRVRYGSHGYRFVESFDRGQPTDALRRAPRFAFVNEVTPE